MVFSLESNLSVEIYVEDCYSVENQRDNSLIYPHSDEIWHNWFTYWLDYLKDQLPESESYEIGLRLTNDEEIQSLNYQYLQKNTPTDVLAFSTLEGENYDQLRDLSMDEPLYLGDIIISIDRAVIQSNKYGHSLEIELAWLASHGLLHLLGWDHPDQESLFQMLTLQENLLKLINLHIPQLLEKSCQEYLNQYI
jgi:probable rRNA maturation factor